jgi:hypothetical protein
MIDKGHNNNSYEEKHSQSAAKTLQFTSSYNHVIESYKEGCRYAFTKLKLLSKRTRSIWYVAEVSPFVTGVLISS